MGDRLELYLLIYVVYNLVGAFLGFATMLRGESLSARVNSQCAGKSVKMCRACVRCVGMCSQGCNSLAYDVKW